MGEGARAIGDRQGCCLDTMLVFISLAAQLETYLSYGVCARALGECGWARAIGSVRRNDLSCGSVRTARAARTPRCSARRIGS
jgi:hypothetical protein